MQVFVDGKLAVLKKNTSFDYVSENSLFTGSDSYTLSISFPLKDCLQNMGIFGFLFRKDVDKNHVTMDCYMRDKGFFRSGCITITEVNEVEVKAQFLEGRSASNYDDSFDDVFINRLQLGYPATKSSDNVTPAEAWVPYPGRNEVALPWVNNTSGNIQNEVKKENGVWSWVGQQTLSFQPYLIWLLKRICDVQGYTYDFTEIENSEMKYLVVCNTLPSAWDAPDFAYALPHWSMTEFLEELEKFLFGEFVINHKSKTIAFHFIKGVLAAKDPLMIDKVVDAYTTNISMDKDCDYSGVKNIKYADNDNRYWPYRSCHWYIRDHGSEAVEYDTLAQLLTFAATLKESGVYMNTGGRTGGKYTRGYERGSDGHKLFYAKDVAQYFIMFCYDSIEVKTTTVREEVYHWYKYLNRLEPINQFGKIEYDKEADDVELKIVPAWLDDTDEEHGMCLFLECGEMGSIATLDDDGDGNYTVPTSSGGSFGGSGLTPGSSGRGNSGMGESGGKREVDETDYNDGALAQAQTGKTIEKGEEDKSDEYFDCIYVGYWDGTNRVPAQMPFPFTHSLVTKNDFTRTDFPYTLSLQRATQCYDRSALPVIDGKKKYTFSWIGDTIPDPRTVFYIWGKKYLCEKITAQFTENGMSQLLKGEFYRILE